MRRIERRLLERTPQLHRAAPPAQREPAIADHTELAICDQTIDEHRIGLKPLLRRVWTPGGGSRPHALVQHRFAWRWLVGFVHPASGRTVFHLATAVSIELFEVELAAFAQQVGAGPTKQIVLVLDRAGWHCSVRLRVREHVHLLFLPAYSPELQPAEHLWPLTNTALANRHFATIEDLEDAQAARCVALQARPDLIRSTTRFHIRSLVLWQLGV
jgi:transposase